MPFFEKSFECMLCGHVFKEFRIRKSKLRVVKVDTDFARHCVGPCTAHYIVSVCPSCGFSFSSGFTSSFPSDELLREIRLSILPSPEDFSGERTHELALLSLQRALWCANLKKERYSVQAGLFLHLAWIHRFAGEEEEEKINLRNALNYFIKVYEAEDIIEEARVMYIIGELYHRLGNDNEAVRWFSDTIGRHKKKYPQYAKLARQQWQIIREVDFE